MKGPAFLAITQGSARAIHFSLATEKSQQHDFISSSTLPTAAPNEARKNLTDLFSMPLPANPSSKLTQMQISSNHFPAKNVSRALYYLQDNIQPNLSKASRAKGTGETSHFLRCPHA